MLERSVSGVSRASGHRRAHRRAAADGRRRSAGVSARRQSRCASSPAASGGRIRWRTRSAPLAREPSVIVIHDAARPFVTRRSDHAHDRGGGRVGRRGRGAAGARHGQAGGAHGRQAHHERVSGESWMVKATLPRETIFLAQTPQAFRREVLAAALDFAARTERRRDRRSGARRARRSSGADRRGRGVEHQDHDAGGSVVAEAIARGGRSHGPDPDRARRHRLRSASARRRPAAVSAA